MARYAPEHKDATRRRMIETSGRRFKRDGFDGAGISALVADAGLTNGAFYGHFASKNALIATVVSEQLAAQVEAVEALPLGLGSVEAFVREYLSPEHRDDPGNGCPSAALLDEISRQDVATRQAYTDGARALIAAIERTPRAPLARSVHGTARSACSRCWSRRSSSPAQSPTRSCPTRSSRRPT